jgi:hypothetical protein
LQEIEGDVLVAKKALRIYVPVRYAERGLAQIGLETYIVGIFPIVVGDEYFSVMMVNAMMRIEPTSTVKTVILEEEYYEFTFAAGAVVVPSMNLVKNDQLVYKIYDEILSKGRVPWYMSYNLLSKIFDTAKSHAGANIGQNQEVTELIVSLIARDPNDRARYYRQIVKSQEDMMSNPPDFVPLRSVTYAATNTTTKLGGSYFREGVVSALNSPADRVESIEELLRR